MIYSPLPSLLKGKALVRRGLYAMYGFGSDGDGVFADRHNLLQVPNAFQFWTATLATVTANQGTAPDGTALADRIQITAAASFVQQTYTFQSAANVLHTFSVYVKRNTGTNQSFRIRINDGTSITYSGALTATADWQRFEVAKTVVAGAGDVQIRSVDDATAADLLVWGAQLEEGTTQGFDDNNFSSTIQLLQDFGGKGLHLTRGSAAGVDTNDPGIRPGWWTFDGVDNYARATGVLTLPAERTYLAVVRPRVDVAATRVYLSEEASSYDALTISTGTKFRSLETYNAVAQTLTGNTVLVPGTWYVLCSVRRSSYFAQFVNNIKQTSAANEAPPLLALSARPLTIGAFNTTTLFLDGDIAFVAIYQVGLSDTEVLQNYYALKSGLGHREIVI